MDQFTFGILLGRRRYYFSAAHFVVGEDYAETIHGHNFPIEVELYGHLDDKAMVVDFLELQPIIEEAIEEWDHKILLPGRALEITFEKENLMWTYRGKKYSLPKSDVVILPVDNVTVEELARLFNEKLAVSLRKIPNLKLLRTKLGEYEWQMASHTIELSSKSI
ncbi:MAG: 6-pyruvoyl tetrahydropterin synthase family protein [Candidatus Hermodarchaeota archaeon]